MRRNIRRHPSGLPPRDKRPIHHDHHGLVPRRAAATAVAQVFPKQHHNTRQHAPEVAPSWRAVPNPAEGSTVSLHGGQVVAWVAGRPVLSLHATGRGASCAQQPDPAMVQHTANGSLGQCMYPDQPHAAQRDAATAHGRKEWCVRRAKPRAPHHTCSAQQQQSQSAAPP